MLPRADETVSAVRAEGELRSERRAGSCLTRLTPASRTVAQSATSGRGRELTARVACRCVIAAGTARQGRLISQTLERDVQHQLALSLFGLSLSCVYVCVRACVSVSLFLSSSVSFSLSFSLLFSSLSLSSLVSCQRPHVFTWMAPSSRFRRGAGSGDADGGGPRASLPIFCRQHMRSRTPVWTSEPERSARQAAAAPRQGDMLPQGRARAAAGAAGVSAAGGVVQTPMRATLTAAGASRIYASRCCSFPEGCQVCRAWQVGVRCQ